ncbi:hypothetical protein BDV93DRAFT_83639 [Ceratobasidium sp. AG-I]|nr:hypothetical protein BDV93DRAFT_83639 [Ceratobasidium sp. AG-I]
MGFQWTQYRCVFNSTTSLPGWLTIRSTGKSVSYSIGMDCRLNSDKYGPDKPFYFHRNPCSDDPYEFWGFFSPSSDPTCPVSQGEFERRDWIPYYSVQFSTYDVSNDWNIRYEKLLESGLAAIPGSYPGAHIEDVS